MRGGGDAEDDGEQNDARAPFSARALHGMGDAEAGVDAAVDAEGGEDFRIGADAGLEDGGREAIERESRIAAEVAVEAARDPPESARPERSRRRGTAGAAAGRHG